MAGWTIPMGSQVSLEADRIRQREAAEAVRRDELLARLRQARAVVMGEDGCHCPNACDCGGTGFPHPSRVTPTGPGHVTGLQPEGYDPSNEPCPNGPQGDHVWTNRDPFCRYCETDMRGACCGDPGDCTERCP